MVWRRPSRRWRVVRGVVAAVAVGGGGGAGSVRARKPPGGVPSDSLWPVVILRGRHIVELAPSAPVAPPLAILPALARPLASAVAVRRPRRAPSRGARSHERPVVVGNGHPSQRRRAGHGQHGGGGGDALEHGGGEAVVAPSGSWSCAAPRRAAAPRARPTTNPEIR